MHLSLASAMLTYDINLSDLYFLVLKSGQPLQFRKEVRPKNIGKCSQSIYKNQKQSLHELHL